MDADRMKRINDDRPASLGLLAPRFVVRAEGAAFLGGSLYLYAEYGHSWLLFLVLFLAPDLSMLAYLVNPRVGAAAYNLVHALVWPAALVVFALATDDDLVLSLGLIWLAHIGADRFVGYGLKYPDDFKETHIQRL